MLGVEDLALCFAQGASCPAKSHYDEPPSQVFPTVWAYILKPHPCSPLPKRKEQHTAKTLHPAVPALPIVEPKSASKQVLEEASFAKPQAFEGAGLRLLGHGDLGMWGLTLSLLRLEDEAWPVGFKLYYRGLDK